MNKMYFSIHGISLVPQLLRKSCWYAGRRMRIDWRHGKSRMSLDKMILPELDEKCQQVRDANKCINNTKIIAMTPGRMRVSSL